MNEINWQYVAAAIVGIVAAARLTRLIVEDEYPPSAWVRSKWDGITNDGPWAKLVHCPWCAGPYVSGIILLWAVLSHLHWTWWLFNGWLAMSYAASWIVFHDED